MSDLEAVLAHIESDLDAAHERLIALLRMRLTDPAYTQECRACADWRVQDLRDIGFEAVARQRQGQPVGPIELWDHDPFEARTGTAIAAR